MNYKLEVETTTMGDGSKKYKYWARLWKSWWDRIKGHYTIYVYNKSDKSICCVTYQAYVNYHELDKEDIANFKQCMDNKIKSLKSMQIKSQTINIIQ